MSYYIIIRGPLGIGKTTISDKLVKILDGIHISVDKVLEENKLERKEGNYTPEDFIKANEIVMSKVKKALLDGKIVIFDGCFYFKEQIDHIERNLKGEHYIFNLKASLESCIKRDKSRKRVYGEDAARAVYEKVQAFSYGIEINTDSITENQVIKEILCHLPKTK